MSSVHEYFLQFIIIVRKKPEKTNTSHESKYDNPLHVYSNSNDDEKVIK